MGAAFMVLLPEEMNGSRRCCAAAPIDRALRLGATTSPSCGRWRSALVIILFLIFEPDGLAHRWR